MLVESKFHQGWYALAQKRQSPFFNARPSADVCSINLLVIHNISLPAANFNTHYVDNLFMGCLDCSQHKSFSSLEGLEVSAHFFIRRDGSLLQYVSCLDRAWHAGVSSWDSVEGCNDYSIGIELEGCDDIDYTPEQYLSLAQVSLNLCIEYQIPLDRIVGHCDIAPGRKTDPGASFDWSYFKSILNFPS